MMFWNSKNLLLIKACSILLVLLLTSCLPEQQIRVPVTDTNNATNTTNPPADTISNVFGTKINWLNSGISSNTATVDIGNAKSVYLIGDQVNDYLQDTSNFGAIYCIELRFPQTANTKPNRLRVKVSPGVSNQFAVGTTTRYLTVNLGTDLGNSICNKSTVEIVNGKSVTVAAGDSNYDGDVNANDLTIVSKTIDLCSNCTNIYSSNEVILYKLNSSSDIFERVETDKIEYSTLVLRIDTNSNSSNGSNSCSNSDCSSKGFDCCLQGQCINEKQIKVSGVNLDPTGFAVAEQLKFTDMNWYKSYPQFYYACLERPPEDSVPPTPADPVDPVGDTKTRLDSLTNDFNCIEEMKSNSLSTPFHTNPVNSSATYTACDVNNSTSINYYQSVMKRLYQNCGCSEKIDLNNMIAICPKYTYSPLFQSDINGVITTTVRAYNCVVPPVSQTPLPFQNMQAAINSRSAPHRFFDTNNIEIDPTVALPSGATGIQEGTPFQYLDKFYIFPQNGSFNMNSILGQMNIQLNQASPAFKIDIDFDKQYMIATSSGFFQACPTCAKDSWFNNFTAFPYANTGVGVQPVGFTARRDTFGTNASLGNYEDTIFGRACFVPPTMLPFSHLEGATEQDQRLTRLKTQAALFVNGYQRDWYGFNKGALIGSFDGVTWFAVGKGRIVKSTSNVLYLAINAPFADLSSPTNHIVSIQEYDFTSTAAIYDYLPNKEINDSTQNEAGSCQEWHKCETDSHCISKLGWEYTCADVSFQRTHWPQFEALGAREIANAKQSGTIISFLQQNVLPPGSGTKRCIYRGAGAPCRIDYENITDQGVRKNLTCAPNFYCASLNNNVAFNTEVARFARPLNELVESNNHLFGQDANILGRPKQYLGFGNLSALPNEVVSTLTSNLSLIDPSGSGQFGLCRPGKLLPDYQTLLTTKDWNQAQQHKSADTKYRTDYISQIAGCNSALYTNLRYSSCPMLDETGNYINTQDEFLNDNFIIPGINTPQTKEFVTAWYTTSQNACGLESLDSTAAPLTSSTSDELKNFSAFKTIQSSSLNSSGIVFEKSLALDSCQRKAGSVCHTDLDCSPNRLMASVIDLSPLSTFGNLAEKNYYEEYLVCGQARAEPIPGSADYNTYNIHNNRCCRPVGQELTMFTENSPRAIESTGLDSSVFGALNPNITNRYSRYSVVDATVNQFTRKSNLIRPSANTIDSDLNKSIDNSINITNVNQWQTIHDTATRTCCGGDWVRKFDDGTNDWTKQRLSLNPTNFKCLNYNSQLFLSSDATAYNLTSSELDRAKLSMCQNGNQGRNGTNGGCAQNEMASLSSFTVRKPVLNDITTEMELRTTNTTTQTDWERNPLAYSDLFWAYSDSLIVKASNLFLEWSIAANYADAIGVNANNPVAVAILTVLPGWITYNDFNDDIRISLTNPIAGQPDVLCEEVQPIAYTNSTDGGIEDPYTHWRFSDDPSNDFTDSEGYCQSAGVNQTPATNNCCYMYDPLTRMLRVAFDSDDTVNRPANFSDRDSHMIINWTAVGSLAWELKQAIANGSASAADPTMSPHRRSSTPGNERYYLEKLGKLEYVGIPQMAYEPIYCNDNYQNLVPGIFKVDAFGQALKTVMDFINHDRTFTDSAVKNPWDSDAAVSASVNADGLNLNLAATQELLQIQPIFSDNKFLCCLELGSQIDTNASNTQCCSGHAIADPDQDGKKKCALPSGTNLNVYFNKFVSSEGISTSLASPLLDGDFDSRTGEPRQVADVINKLTALGREFCDSKRVRTGGAFGRANAQIQQDTKQSIYGIVDDLQDNDTTRTPQTGYNVFQRGFKWNHHIYCDIAN